MTTATKEFTEACPDCGRNVKGKSLSGARSRLRAHQRMEHPEPRENREPTVEPSEPPPLTETEMGEAVHERHQLVMDKVMDASQGPRVFDSGSGPAEGGTDPEPVNEPEVLETPTTKALDTKQLLDGLYGADKLGVLTWIHGKFQKPGNLFKAMHEVGLK